MEWPMILTTDMSHATQMVIAVCVGIGFGFVLERAGFGTAKNLTSIFYGRDFRVMRVMFTAIITGMMGLYFLDLANVMPIGNIGLMPTYILPQLIGGLLFGVGFIVGGYCPGTSLVGMVGGKLDAILFVVGIFVGTQVFTMSYDMFESFHNSTAMGQILMHEYFGVPSAVMVMGVTLFAVGALYGVTRVETLVNASLKTKEQR